MVNSAKQIIITATVAAIPTTVCFHDHSQL